MNSTKFVLLDNNVVPSQSPIININSVGLFEGDVITEELYANGTTIYFFKEHYERITKWISYLNMATPLEFTLSVLNKAIIRLLNANKFLQGASIKIIIFKKDNAESNNNSNSSSYLVIADKLEESRHTYNKTGLKIGLFTDIKKSVNIISQLKHTNKHLYNKAKVFCKENRFDNCIILNDNDNIIETINSSIFVVKGDTIFTPSINGNYEVIQAKIIELSLKIGININDTYNIMYKDLLEADEIFIADVINGIRWVVAFEDKRFYNKISKRLFDNFFI